MSISKKKDHDRPIRVGVTGCGKIASRHFEAIKNLPSLFELQCICDSDPLNLETVSGQLNVKGYPDLAAMLSAEDGPDLVTLCSPSGLHARQTIQAAGKNRHVITEKPMATRWSDGIDMVRACDEAGVRLFVVKQNRYQPALQLLKRALQEGRFGRVFMVSMNIFWTRPQTYYDQAPWRGTFEFDGGALMNQASHYVDLLDWLIGPVESVQAMMSTLAIRMEAEDTATLNLRWRSGTLGSMCVTMLTFPKNLEASLTILGEKGSVRIAGPSANRVDHWEFADSHPMDSEAKELPDIPADQQGHLKYYENVAATLQGRASPEADGRTGLRSLEIMTAAYLSARDSRTVHLPLIL